MGTRAYQSGRDRRVSRVAATAQVAPCLASCQASVAPPQLSPPLGLVAAESGTLREKNQKPELQRFF
jgi:hypothetical protein